MIKHFLLFLAIGLTTATATRAQWTQTDRLAKDALTGLNAVLGSIERQQQNKIFSEEKARYRQVFDDAYAAAKAFEAENNYEEALLKYEEASKLNVKYGYTNQQPLSIKLANLYPLAGRSEEGPSILNNATVTLSDYSGYRYMKENPIYKTKKENSWVKITRVCCSDKETRVEFECTPNDGSAKVYAMPKTYIKGNKGGKLTISDVENVAIYPNYTYIPYPYLKLRFAIIFPALPSEASEFDLVMPSSKWKFEDIKCK